MPNPVVLLHGFTGSVRSTWKPTGILDLLADFGREALPIDMPGHGDAELKSHDPADYAELEAKLLASLPDGPIETIR